MHRCYKFINFILLAVFLGACSSAEEPAPTATQPPAPTDINQEAATEEEVIPPETPTPVPTTETPQSFRIGLVSDVDGMDDWTWNAGAWKGLEIAEDRLGVEVAFLESTQESDYSIHIASFIEQGFNLIVTMGASMAEDTRSFAEQNPNINFIIVDQAFDPPLPNILGVSFSTDKSAFLAGYLAAGMTKSGVVATFGGFDFPPITVYMVGFRNGVDYYNQQHSTNVEVLGMDRVIENFDSQEDGRRVAAEFIASGADIIMPVEGRDVVCLGSAFAVMENPGTMFIGVDFDWCINEEEFCSVTLTSIFNSIDMGVFWAVQQLKEGTIQGGVYSAVAMLPLYEFEEVVPKDLKEEMDAVRQGLMDGSISTGWTPPE